MIAIVSRSFTPVFTPLSQDAVVTTNPEWMAIGTCVELPPETFFPSDGVGVIAAQKICGNCPVQAACLEYAINERIPHGVWGGASERERRRIIKKRSRRIMVEAS